jgi:hypothetical protein
MKPSVLGGVSVLLASACLGLDSRAGERPPYEMIVKDMLATVEEINDILAGITEKEGSAEAATPKLKTAADKMLQLRKQADQAKQPDKTEKDRLAREYAPKFELAVKKLRDQTIRVKGIPGGDEALEKLAVLNDKKDPKDKKKGGK